MGGILLVFLAFIGGILVGNAETSLFNGDPLSILGTAVYGAAMVGAVMRDAE